MKISWENVHLSSIMCYCVLKVSKGRNPCRISKCSSIKGFYDNFESKLRWILLAMFVEQFMPFFRESGNNIYVWHLFKDSCTAKAHTAFHLINVGVWMKATIIFLKVLDHVNCSHRRDVTFRLFRKNDRFDRSFTIYCSFSGMTQFFWPDSAPEITRINDTNVIWISDHSCIASDRSCW